MATYTDISNAALALVAAVPAGSVPLGNAATALIYQDPSLVPASLGDIAAANTEWETRFAAAYTDSSINTNPTVALALYSVMEAIRLRPPAIGSSSYANGRILARAVLAEGFNYSSSTVDRLAVKATLVSILGA